MILGHTESGILMVDSGGPSPTDAERAAYWARVGGWTDAEIRDGAHLPRKPVVVVSPASASSSEIATAIGLAIRDAVVAGVDGTYASKSDIEAAAVARREARTAGIARSLFETDDEVTEFVWTRSELCGWDGTGTWEAHDAKRQSRYDATMQRCWDRAHAGESPEWRWYVRAADRAKAILACEERRHPLMTVTLGGDA